MSKEQMLKAMSDCVVDMEDEKVITAAEEYIKAGYEPLVLVFLTDLLTE